MRPADNLPAWRSHKVVRAGPIVRFGNADAPLTIVCATDAGGPDVVVEVPPGVFSRGRPAIGDYLLVYEDGYVSWSPKQAFEDGYTRLPP